MILPLIVLIGSAAAVSAGMYLTVRGFRASAKRAAGVEPNRETADAAHTAVARHDPAAIDLLKRFFDARECAICKRRIAPVQRTGPKPGLLNPTTHETYPWDRIPHDHLSSLLETHLPLCSACQVAESFRQRHPELVVDRDRSPQDAPAAGRVAARP